MSAEEFHTGETSGRYVDGDNFARFVHLDRDGNFVEAVGSKKVATVTPSSGSTTTLANAALTFKLRKLSTKCTLEVPNLIVASNNTANNFVYDLGTLIPAGNRPQREIRIGMLMHDGGTSPAAGTVEAGYAKISTAGVVTFSRISGTSFTNINTCGFFAQDLHWETKI